MIEHQKHTNSVSLCDLSNSSTTTEFWIVSEEQIETPTQTYARDLSWDGHNGQGNKYYFSNDDSVRIRWYEFSNFTATGEISTPCIPAYTTQDDDWDNTHSFHTNSRTPKRNSESKIISIRKFDTTEISCQTWDVSDERIDTPDGTFFRNHLWDDFKGYGSRHYFLDDQGSLRKLSWYPSSNYSWGFIQVPEVDNYNSIEDSWETTHDYRTI